MRERVLLFLKFKPSQLYLLDVVKSQIHHTNGRKKQPNKSKFHHLKRNQVDKRCTDIFLINLFRFGEQ